MNSVHIPEPGIGDYDDGLGIDFEHEIIPYIRESHQIESRISSMRCYLIQRVVSGSIQGTSTAPLPVTAFYYSAPNWRAIIWNNASVYERPDVRPYTNNGSGSVVLTIGGVAQSRVLASGDLISNNEYCLEERFDQASPAPVEAVFNPGFDPSALIVRMYYTTMSQTVNNVRMARGEDATQSLFGWQQYYCNKRDAYQSYHQILVRMPLTTRDMTINDEGRVILQDQDSWMIWEPYVSDFDVLVISAHHTASKREERYEISDKRDSIIQGHLMSQRFHLHLLEFSDTRYNVPITTTPV